MEKSMSETQPPIFRMPAEVLVLIFNELDVKDLIRAQLVCRVFNDVIKDSLELQYHIELAADCMIDGPRNPGSLSTGQRFQLLLDRRRRWRQLDWLQTTTVPMQGSCQAYELVGGVFAKTSSIHIPAGSRHLIATWLPSSTERTRTLVREDLGIVSKDFAIDPSQDLIALVTTDETDIDNIDIVIHLRTISTNRPHPKAANPQLTTGTPFPIGTCFVQIADDIIGMFFWIHGPALVLWNWRAGEVVLHNTNVFGGPMRAWDFSFLSPRAYMMTMTAGAGAIEIFTFDAQSRKDPSELASTRVAVLALPELQERMEVRHFSTHSAPFLGCLMNEDKPFVTSQEDRIHLMEFSYNGVIRRFQLYVKNSFLMGLIPSQLGEDFTPRTLSWEEWGPDNTRLLEQDSHYQWLRYVHGQRVALPPRVISHQPDLANEITILDFNVHPKRTNDPVKIQEQGDFESSYELVTEPSVVSAKGLFKEDVVTRLPHSIASRIGPFSYSGIMIDEERLVGMKILSQHAVLFIDGDVSDLDVFTF